MPEYLITVTTDDGDMLLSHSLPEDVHPEILFDACVEVAAAVRKGGWWDDNPDEEE